MPLIEELPVTQVQRQSHGWAYIPIADPIAAVQLGNRKRNRDGTIAATATAKQQKATQARLDSLSKENYKDGVTVPIPAREKARKDGKKMTPNVRRILTYQRGFAHYLADEEAMGANSTTPNTTQLPIQNQAAAQVDGRRKDAPGKARRGRPPAAEKEKMLPPPKPMTGRHRRNDSREDRDKDKDSDVDMSDAPSTVPIPPPASSLTTSTPTPNLPLPTTDPQLDIHPLLRTLSLPLMPSSRVMSILQSEPPLSWTAARAKPTDDNNERPTRHFCGVCGYWGRVKCRRCGEWTCGVMECWKGHGGVCVAAGMV